MFLIFDVRLFAAAFCSEAEDNKATEANKSVGNNIPAGIDPMGTSQNIHREGRSPRCASVKDYCKCASLASANRSPVVDLIYTSCLCEPQELISNY